MFQPPYEITDKMLSLVSSISEKIGRISVTKNLDAKPHLRKNNKIRSIHSSLKIEANSLSLSQVRDVINGRIVLGERKEIQEVKNAYEAYEELSTINPFSIKEIKRLHFVMTKYIVEEAGEFRRGEEGVFHGEKCIFIAPPAKFVPAFMSDLFHWMEHSEQKVHPLIMASIFHYEFVFIHPFSDGNGRMARLWHTAILSKWNALFEFIPLESQIEKFQEEYYDAIARCHKEGKSNEFIEFMLSQIDNILDEIINDSNSDDGYLSEYLKKLLSVMEYDVPYTAFSIMEKLHISSKENFRKNYMHPAIELGLVQMTIPDKPRSKNQRYIKK